MIGEPEIDGDWGGAPPKRGPERGPEQEQEPLRERVRASWAPWWWALAGVVAASAVWAGALAVQDRFSDAPRIGYRHSADLCKEVRLKVVGQAVGQSVGRAFDGSQSSQGTGPEQDWAHCWVGMRWQEDAVSYEAQAQVELHKKTDPAAEFATGPGTNPGMRLDPEDRREVPGLGERAVLDRYYGETGERLMVLDQGAVFTLVVEWQQVKGDQPSGVDVNAIDAAMIEDMRTLMAELRQ